MLLQTGTVLNRRYRTEWVLRQGEFGAVYRARDLGLDRPVALKESLDTFPSTRQQFQHEAGLLAQLAHPNLPRVIDHFFVSGVGQYLVMDWIEGLSLQEMLAQAGGPLPQEDVLAWIDPICEALSYLHTHTPPVVHCDVKPDNIRITPSGQAVLVDFGILKVSYSSRYPMLAARGATPGYSPPEQYGAGQIDGRADVYALGATLYTLLTGQKPPESVRRIGKDELLTWHANLAFPSSHVRAVVYKAMALNAGQRYQTVRDLQQSLAGPVSLAGISLKRLFRRAWAVLRPVARSKKTRCSTAPT